MLLLVIAAALIIVPALMMSCHISMIFKTPTPMRPNYIRNSINWVHRSLDSSYQRPSSKSFHISSQALLARKKTARERTVDRSSEAENTDDEVDDSKIFADAVKFLQRSLSNSPRALSSTSKDGALIIIRIIYFKSKKLTMPTCRRKNSNNLFGSGSKRFGH